MKNFKKRYAFTTAEILISLLLIGILVSFSLPTLILNYKKNTTAVILKDTYRELNTAITNASIEKKCAGDLVCKDLLTNFGKTLSDQYHLTRYCDKNTSCWNDKVYLNIDNNISNAENADVIINYNNIENSQNFIDEKGKIYNIQITNPNCNTDVSEDLSDDDKVPKNHKLKKVCGYITVDIDGNKNINTFGIDVFEFILTNQKNNYLYPFGGKYHIEYWKKHNTCQPENNFYNGQSCTGRIMDEDWKINYFNE